MANLGDNRPHFFFLAPHQLDDLEPRADIRGPYGGSIAHHCALFATRRGSGVITQVTVRLSGIPAAIFGSGVLVRQYLKLPRSTSLSPSTARGGERHARDQEGGSTPNNIMNLGKLLRV